MIMVTNRLSILKNPSVTLRNRSVHTDDILPCVPTTNHLTAMAVVRGLLVILLTMRSLSCHRTIPKVLEYFKTRDITSINAVLCENRGVSKLMGKHFLTHVTNVNDIRSFTSQHYQIGVIIDLGCTHSWEILQKVSEDHFFNTSFAYALMIAEEDWDLKPLESMDIGFDSDVTIFFNGTLYDLFRTAEDEPLVLSMIGTWNEEEGLSVYPRPPRWDLNGATLKAVTVLKEFNKHLAGKREFYDSNYLASIDALSRIATKRHTYAEFLMNFRTNLSLTPDWGYYNQVTGKFDEDSMYGELEHDKTDFGLTESWMYSTRINTAFFAPVTHYLKSCVVFRHPAAGASISAFARPFAWTTWLVFFLFVLVGSGCLILIRRRNWKDAPPAEPQYSNSFLQVTAVMCLQGSYISSIKIPTRILSLFLHVMAMMVYTYYGAEILGYLLSPTPRTITTVEKLLDSHMDLWAENVSFHRSHFKGCISARATKYYNLAIMKATPDKDRFIDRSVGLDMVQRGGAALYGVTWNLYESIPKTYSSPEICSLYFMELLTIKTAVAIQKRSHYREMYYKATQRVIESGLNDLETKRWDPQKPLCLGTEANSAVKLEATFIALMIYAFGSVLSVIFLFIEISTKYHEKSRKLCKFSN